MTQLSRCSFCGMQPDNLRNDIAEALPTPTLDQLLHCNSPPTYGVEPLVKSQLTRVRDKMDILDEAIENLQKARSLLQQEEAKLSCIISSLRRVPPEILSEIFVTYAESWWLRLSEWQLRGALPKHEYVGWDGIDDEKWDGWFDKGGQNGDPDQDLTDLALRPTNVLSQVCQTWRAAARACSNLWSDISLHEEYRSPAAQSFLEQQLRLSSNRPLRIHTSHRLTKSHFIPLLQDIVPTSHRWSSINMVVDDASHPVFPRASISMPFPSLVSLSIILKHPDPFEQVVGNVEFVYKITAADAPLLREVTLSWPDHARAKFDLPWSQLRKFRCWGCNGEATVGIMGSLQNVEELDLLGIYRYGNSLRGLSVQSLHLPSLCSLRLSDLGCGGPGTTGRILPYMKTPALQTLYWTAMKSGEMKNLEDMFSGRRLNIGQTVLRCLHLYNPESGILGPGEIRGERWGNLLQVIGPQFESLKIEYPTSSGADVTQVVEELVSGLNRGTLPHFHHCLLQGVHINSHTLWDLIKFVETRGCDIRVRSCTFNTQEEFDFAFLTRPPKSIPDGAYLELDVEAPNRKRLVYTLENGAEVKESCCCRLGGGPPREGRRSNVLRVI